MPLGDKNDLTLSLTIQTQQAKAKMARSGYSVPPRPLAELPTVPSDVTDLTDENLMGLFSRLVAWTDHIAGQLALQEVDERFAESTYDLIWAQVLADTMQGRTRNEASVTMCKAQTNIAPAVVEERDNKDKVYARRKIFQLMFNNLERDGALVSRELTRRLGRAGNEGRVHRYQP